MSNKLSGSLVIHATAKVERLALPSIKPALLEFGSHLDGKLNGGWWLEQEINHTANVWIPARSKQLVIVSTNQASLHPISRAFEVLDSISVGSRHLHKLHLLMQGLLDHQYACVVNNIGSKGTFSLLSHGVPMRVFLAFDTQDHSVQLVWSTEDLISEMREIYGLRYFFYSLPTIIDRPVFIHTQTLCAHWWRWNQSFGYTPDARLKACNALEIFLYKDPTIESLS